MRSRFRPVRALAGAVVALAVLATTASAGPPWISIEYPANPFDQASRGALLVVHTYHHGAPRDFPVVAYAEGVVDGQRRRIELEVVPTSLAGYWAVRGALPEGGTWAVVATMTDTDTNYLATVLTAFSAGDRLIAVQVPRRTMSTTPRAATAQDVEAFLAEVMRQDVRRAGGTLPAGRLLAVLALVLVPGGIIAARRRSGAPRL